MLKTKMKGGASQTVTLNNKKALFIVHGTHGDVQSMK